MKIYQLVRLSFGKATSRAPSIIGKMKFPSTVGIDGIRKNHTISVPWIVKSLLYVSDVIKPPVGCKSSIRIIAAATLAIAKKTRMVKR